MGKRVLVVLVLLAGLIAPGSAAGAVTRSSITITARVYVDGVQTSAPTAMPGEQVVLAGTVTYAKGRIVVLQRHVDGAWREVSRRAASGTWRFPILAPAPGAYRYRVVALATYWHGSVISQPRTLTVVKPSISLASASSAEAGRLVTFTGAAVPARPGHPVQLWELRGARWTPLASAKQSATGGFTMRLRAGTVGAHTYRAVTLAPTNWFDIRSRGRTVTTTEAAGVRSTYLSDVTPLLHDPAAASYVVDAITVGGRSYPKSIHTSAPLLSYQLGADAGSLGTAIALKAATRDAIAYAGDRLVEVRVDGVLRLRRFIQDDQVVPLTLDLRGKQVLTIRSYDRGPLDLGFGSDLVLVTPVVSSAARSERGVDLTTSLSELIPRARSAAIKTNQVIDSASQTLYGGSVVLPASNVSETIGAVEYVLGGAYARLTGVPAVTGEATNRHTGRVEVYGDGALLATLPARFNRRDLATVDVSGVQRLRLKLVADPPAEGWTFSWAVAFADPRLI